MKWAWKIGRFAGISVHIHATFLLLIAWLVFTEWRQTHNLQTMTGAVLLILALFACVVLHEFGHALAARRFGVNTRDITLLPIGGISRLERIPNDPRQELWIALAGPAVTAAIAISLFALLWIAGVRSIPLPGNTWTGVSFFEQLALANTVLFVFNLLPAFPMDGGRVFRAILARRMNYATATRVAARVGQGMALVFGLLGLMANPYLLFIAFFVWMGATQEAAMAELKAALSGITVRHLTVTDFHALARSDALQNVVDLTLHGTQQDFPVIENGSLAGILTNQDLLQGLSRLGGNATVGEIMRNDCPPLEASETIQTVLEKCNDIDRLVFPVIEKGRFLGLFTLKNLGEFMLIHAALSGDRTQKKPLHRGLPVSKQKPLPRIVA
jgi:Zn-dependent protease/predicted transcriptional regulator